MRAASAWYSEIKNWNFATSTGKPGSVTGHFTQNVWKESELIGSGFSNYSESISGKIWNKVIVVTNFNIGGNMQDAYAANVKANSTRCANY